MNTAAPHRRQETFVVRANELDRHGFATAPALCNFLQELAGVHATELGLGIDDLLAQEGLTWMMAGLHLEFHKQAQWRDAITVTTWPSGSRGRLMATRDFLAHDQHGDTILTGVSEWLMVERQSSKIVRLPDHVRQLAPDGIERAPIDGDYKIPPFTTPRWCQQMAVRRAEIDINGHANNVHYVTWLLEALPAAFDARALRRLDISYRAGARAHDVILSEATPLDEHQTLHRIRLADTTAPLTLARALWSPLC